MNNPSPLIPQGSLLEQKNKSRSRVKVAFFCVVGVHVVAILVALLAQGCKREPTPPVEGGQPVVPIDTNLPAMDTNQAGAVALASNTAAQLPPSEQLAAPVTTAQEYAVQKGDSFYTIGKKFNVSVKAIQAANPTVNPSKLQISQKLIIPPPVAATTVPSAPGAAPALDSGEHLYEVKSGDSLTKIAKDHGTTVNALRKANKLTTDKIKVGDKLKIPVSVAPVPAPAPTTAVPVTAPAPATGAAPR
jgi:LysM repeat protein